MLGVELVGVVDITEKTATEVATEYNI